MLITGTAENCLFTAMPFVGGYRDMCEFFVKDGIHFNDEGYGVLAGVMKGKF